MLCPKNPGCSYVQELIGKGDQDFFKKVGAGGWNGGQTRRDYLKRENKYLAQTLVSNFLHPETPLAFLPSNIMEDINPNQEALCTNTKSF